jgi:hypothetical protein
MTEFLENGDCGNFPALLPQLREQFAENATSCQKELRGCMRSSLMAIYGNVGISVMHNIPFPKGGTPADYRWSILGRLSRFRTNGRAGQRFWKALIFGCAIPKTQEIEWLNNEMP